MIQKDVLQHSPAENALIIPERELGEVVSGCEAIQTPEGTKLLSVYRGYLLWFKQEQPKEPIEEPEPGFLPNPASVSQSQEPRIQNDENSNPVLNGIAKIRGFTLESNSSVDTYISEMSRMSVQPTAHFGIGSRGVIDSNAGRDLISRTATGSLSNKSTSTRTKLFFKLSRSKAGSAQEVLIFQNLTQQERWRTKFSKAPVFFSDFSSRYRVIEHLSKDKQLKILLVQELQTSQFGIARVQKLNNPMDRGETVKAKLKFLNESKILIRLRDSGFVQKFREMCITNDSLMIVQESLDTVGFQSWFKEWWCVDICDPQNVGPVYLLMLDLGKIVLNLANYDIAHCSFTKSHLAVLNNKLMERSALSAVARESPPGFSPLKRVEASPAGLVNTSSLKVAKMDPENPGTPRVSQGLFDSGLGGLPSTMNITGQRKIFLSGFSGAIDLKKAQKTIGPNSSFKSLLPDQDMSDYGMEWDFKQLAALSMDIFNLGIIFYEM